MARRKNQASRRLQLTQATRKVIATRGIEGVRIKDVAAEAGLSSQSVLYYYPELSDLVEESIAHTVERFAERRRVAAVAIADPRAALVATIRDGLPSGPDDEDLRILYEAAGYFRDSPALGDQIRSLTARQVQVYRDILVQGHEQGVFELQAEPDTIARNLVALEDAYGLYVISGAPMVDEALRLILSFASIATRCEFAP